MIVLACAAETIGILAGLTIVVVIAAWLCYPPMKGNRK